MLINTNLNRESISDAEQDPTHAIRAPTRLEPAIDPTAFRPTETNRRIHHRLGAQARVFRNEQLAIIIIWREVHGARVPLREQHESLDEAERLPEMINLVWRTSASAADAAAELLLAPNGALDLLVHGVVQLLVDVLCTHRAIRAIKRHVSGRDGENGEGEHRLLFEQVRHGLNIGVVGDRQRRERVEILVEILDVGDALFNPEPTATDEAQARPNADDGIRRLEREKIAVRLIGAASVGRHNAAVLCTTADLTILLMGSMVQQLERIGLRVDRGRLQQHGGLIAERRGEVIVVVEVVVFVVHGNIAAAHRSRRVAVHQRARDHGKIIPIEIAVHTRPIIVLSAIIVSRRRAGTTTAPTARSRNLVFILFLVFITVLVPAPLAREEALLVLAAAALARRLVRIVDGPQIALDLTLAARNAKDKLVY